MCIINCRKIERFVWFVWFVFVFKILLSVKILAIKYFLIPSFNCRVIHTAIFWIVVTLNHQQANMYNSVLVLVFCFGNWLGDYLTYRINLWTCVIYNKQNIVHKVFSKNFINICIVGIVPNNRPILFIIFFGYIVS